MENKNTTNILIGLGVVAVVAYFLLRKPTKAQPKPAPAKLDFTAVGDAKVSTDGKSVTGAPAQADYWKQRAYTKLGYTTSGVLNAKPTQDSETAILGLDRVPSTAASWYSMDYFWYLYDDTTDGTRRAMACKNDIAGANAQTTLYTKGTFTKDDRFGIKFDANKVYFLVNGAQVAETDRAGQDALYAVVCLGKSKGGDIGFNDINFTGVGESKLA